MLKMRLMVSRNLSPTERRRWHVRQGHLRDYTWRRPELANKMAESIFDALKELAGRCCRCPDKPTDWSRIQEAVDRFNRFTPRNAPWNRFGEMPDEDYREKIDILFPPPPFGLV